MELAWKETLELPGIEIESTGGAGGCKAEVEAVWKEIVKSTYILMYSRHAKSSQRHPGIPLSLILLHQGHAAAVPV